MINHQSTVGVITPKFSTKVYTPNPLMNPSDYVMLDSSKSCEHIELFPSLSTVTEHHHTVTLAKTLGLYRAKILAETDEPSLISRAHRIANCSNYIAVRRNGSVIGTRCHRRGCPICESHKSWRASTKVKRIMKRTGHHNMEGYLLTISTGSNVYARDLKEHCTLLSKSFRRFMNYVAIKRDSNIIGTTRGTEISYDPDTGYNPHCHVILWCDGELEIGDSRSYEQSEHRLKMLWRKALKYPSNKVLQTHIRRIGYDAIHGTKDEDKSFIDHVCDTVKYCTKAFKIDKGTCKEMDYSPDATIEIAKSLKNLRLVSHTGWIKKQMAEQTQIDKLISEQRARAEESLKGQLKDTRQLVDEGLLHFIWDHDAYQYVDRDEYEDRCLYAKPSSDQHFIPIHDYGDTCANSPMNSSDLDKSRQLFISNNKTVTDPPLVELVE